MQSVVGVWSTLVGAENAVVVLSQDVIAVDGVPKVTVCSEDVDVAVDGARKGAVVEEGVGETVSVTV